MQEDNVIWDPQHVFQDLENNVFSFLYVPYYQGENQFLRLLSFLVEKIDYEDSELVECIYKMYEQLEKNGVTYLQEQIYKDAEVLEKKREPKEARKTEQGRMSVEQGERSRGQEETLAPKDGARRSMTFDAKEESMSGTSGNLDDLEDPAPKRIFGLFENKRARKAKEPERKEEYYEIAGQALSNYHVAESTEYDEEYGKTAYIRQHPEKKEGVHRLFYLDGRKASDLTVPNLLIGKYKDKVDLYLPDDSVSRMHARILKDQEEYFLEDANSTNGTFQNKTRLEPYERKRLEPGDELRFGNVSLVFR